jgi:hypothetical protein
MTTLKAQVPDSLYKQVQKLVEKEKLSIDELVTISLSAQVKAWMRTDYLEERAMRGSWEKFQRVLAKVPDLEPEDYDKL